MRKVTPASRCLWTLLTLYLALALGGAPLASAADVSPSSVDGLPSLDFPSVLWGNGRFHVPLEQGNLEVCVGEKGEPWTPEVAWQRCQFHPLQGQGLSRGYNLDPLWFRFRVKSGQGWPLPEKILFQTRTTGGDQKVWRRDPSGDFTLQGELLRETPWENLAWRHNTQVFPLYMASENENVFLFSFWGTPMKAMFELWEPQTFAEFDHRYQLIWGGFFGIILVMGFYNLFLYFGLKDVTYVIYSVYSFLSFFSQTCLQRYAAESYLAWNPSHTQLYWNIIFSNFATAFFSLFAKYFTRSNLGLWDWRHPIALFFLEAVFSAFYCIFIGDHQWRGPIAALIGLHHLLHTLIFVVVKAFQGNRDSKILLISFLPMVLGIFWYGLAYVGWIGNTFWTENGIVFGTGLEVVLLSFALADRLHQLKESEMEAQKRLWLKEQESLQNAMHEQAEKLESQRRHEREKLEQLGFVAVHLSDRVNTPLNVLQLTAEELREVEATPEVQKEIAHLAAVMDKAVQQSQEEIHKLSRFRAWAPANAVSRGWDLVEEKLDQVDAQEKNSSIKSA